MSQCFVSRNASRLLFGSSSAMWFSLHAVLQVESKTTFPLSVHIKLQGKRINLNMHSKMSCVCVFDGQKAVPLSYFQPSATAVTNFDPLSS